MDIQLESEEWSDVERIDSSNENVSKYVFTEPDAVSEAVLYRYPTYQKRTVVCCSTQSGCPVGCRFCGAGDYFARNLDADEIVSQPELLFEDRDINARNVDSLQIMFMSMGEPLLNQKELIPAIHKLYEKYPNAALLISTSAPDVDWEPIMEVSEEIDTAGLQFSVHESTNKDRDELIPFEHKLTLEEMAEKGEEWYERTGRSPFFNYCAHEDNSSSEDAQRLRNLFNPDIWECTISVVCERDESIAEANARQRNLASTFEEKMQDVGFSTRMFDPAGQDDIGGGCGQLWFVQDWMQKNADKVHESAGHGEPVLHTPSTKQPV